MRVQSVASIFVYTDIPRGPSRNRRPALRQESGFQPLGMQQIIPLHLRVRGRLSIMADVPSTNLDFSRLAVLQNVHFVPWG